MIISVSSSAGLSSALASAHAGDTIQLAAGTYDAVTLQNLNFAQNVTITSADPLHKAVLTGLTLKNDTGLTIQNVEMFANPTATVTPFQVLSSTNIKLDHLNLHGSMDGNAQNDIDGLMVRNSTNVSVTNSEFQQLFHAVSHLNDTGLTITGNYFHDIRTDGVRGGGSSNVKVADNYFTNFQPVAGDHGDAIQFWTTNTTTSAHDITVTNNVVMRGAGGIIQGVFMRDEVGNVPYVNVTVTGNLVVGGMYNGIAVDDAQHLVVSGNTVTGIPDQLSWINVSDSTDVTMSNNQAAKFLTSGNTNATETNDTVIAMASDGGKSLLQAWLASHAGQVADLPTAALTSTAADQAVAQLKMQIAQVVTLNGTSGADRLSVDTSHSTVINAGDGNDIIYGGGIGHNTLVGGAGDDVYYVKSAFDTVVEQPGGGNDTVSSSDDYTLSDNIETLRLTGSGNYGAGNAMDNKIVGSTGDDQLYGLGGNDNMTGADGNDFVSGGDGNDTIGGDAGNDTVNGDAGNDQISGDAGNDSLSGGAGADTLTGGAGSDTMAGGAGADVFTFRPGDVGLGANQDVILDFSQADGDKINVNPLDAKSSSTANENFTFIGNQAFHHVAGELRFEVQGGNTVVMGDTNGDGAADFSILLKGAFTLHSTDFML